ncbi:MAG: FAD-binding oxidoreductase [Campylobacterota bacterium]|nr:FAD-binding oxidoreductase [Campylobacterota bacterium]
MKCTYDYIIVGAGISGCSVAYELSKHTKNILLVDKLSNIASGASGAAGAFLSPLLGKPNEFKSLVTNALRYTTQLYKKTFPNIIANCGTIRIPKDSNDALKFEQYIPYMDFAYQKDKDGFLFNIGSVVNSFGVCKMMTTSFSTKQSKINTQFNTNIKSVKYENGLWVLNGELEAKNLILTTGASLELLDEFYLSIRGVWGRRIDITTSTKLEHNYHKECSVSKSFKVDENSYQVSIGATHHRDLKTAQTKDDDNDELLKKALDIVELEDIKIKKEYVGCRACSSDYFPMVGKIIDSEKTLKDFPYLKNGTKVDKNRFTRYESLYMLNGVGGRGFVLAPYLAKMLVDNILNDTPIDDNITTDRLFIREVKKVKN